MIAQTGFDFDVFELAGWTKVTVEDFEARRAREFRARQEEERRRQEREERKRREQEEKRYQYREEARRQRCYTSPWDVLGIPRGSSQKIVRAAWVRLMKQHHPDAGGDLGTSQKINAAYESLKGGR